MRGNAPYFHEHLRHISLEYSYLQICKLHDRAFSKATKSYNLSIGYMLEYFAWGNESESIEELTAKLNQLHSCINPARNKVIAHNDLEIVLKGEPVGEFPGGLDVEYFRYLQEFVSRVHERWVGGPYPMKDMNLGQADALEYLDVLRKAEFARNSLSPPT